MKLAEDLRRSVLQAAIEGKLTGGRCEGWRFVRLMDISLSIQYGYNAPAREKGSVKMVRISDIQNNNIQWHNVPYGEISEYEMQKYLLAKNDILFARTGGTVGKSYLVGNIPEKAIYAGYLIRLRISDEVNPQYVKYFMESESYWKQLRSGTTATAQPNCNGKTLSQMIIPLPPIDEQRRIVSRLDAIMPLIAEFESAENELEALERKFPGDMRESLLQAAIEGRLTGSNTNNWRFVRLGEIVAKTIKRGKSPKYVPHSNTLVFAQKCNTKQGNIDLSLALYLDESTIGKYPEEEFMIDGDIVLNSTGRGTLGRVGQYRITDNPQNISLVPDSHVTIIRLMKDISSEYIFYVLKNYQAYIETLGEGSTNQTELSAKKVANLLIPLPPLDEQHKIVERLNELLPLCEAMKGE